ncbi:MAG: hypothetical protein K2K90_11415 [Lachnospiraceae bacterium]|nr:hypothetical protein [Lachnospiraceae bacterium]
MIYRKTWFDYVLWAVYAGICVILLAYVGNHIYAFYVGASLAKLGTFLPFPILLFLYPGIRLSSQAVRKKVHVSAHTAAMTESLAVSVSFVFGLILRLKEGLLMASVYEEAPVFEPGEYYELAMVRAGMESPALAHGLSDLFVRALRVVFSFLGNSMMAAMLFQIFLQMLVLLLAYLAVRKAAGRFAACTVLLLLAFSDAFICKIYVIDPECMLLAVLLAGLCLVLAFVKASLSGQGGLGSFAQAALLGIVLGLLCYLDWSMAVLFLFLAGLFTGKLCAGGGRKRLAGSLFLVLAGSAAGFLCAISMDASLSGVSFYQGLMSWIGPYLNFGMGARVFSVIGMEYPFFALLFLLASFLGFEFIRGGREQDFSLWFLPCILLSPVFLMDFSIVGLGGAALFFWSVMAALGLKNVVFGGQIEVLREKIEKINAAAAPIPVKEAPVAAAAEKPRFLENPLPLPKKHVKREMDYDYEVAEADMHYQMEIAEGDDFDR